MKPSCQINKSSTLNTKSKKSSKDREKRKPQTTTVEVNNHNSTEKGSPTKDSNTRLYAGVDAESLTIYAEQTGIEHLNEEITSTLTEDINYRLRYIINDCLIKARLSGKNAISSNDIEQTFENLKIDKVYGAPSHPNWVNFGYQNLYYLDDKLVNLVDISQEQNVYYQYSEPVITNRWLPESKEISKALKNYFTTMCQMVVSNDLETRKMALKNIRENPRIGTIIEWFYNFGYILLSKDITYDCLTLRALDLIRTLENSQMCRIHVSEKQLKLLVRLILQRLLKSATTNEVLKPICNILCILCERVPLREFVILKVQQKLAQVFDNYNLEMITIINSLGIDGIQDIFLPNLNIFLNKIEETKESPFTYSILETFYILYKEDLIDLYLYNTFFEHFGEYLITFTIPSSLEVKASERREINFARTKCELMKTRRRIQPKSFNFQPISIEEVFEMPPEGSKLRKKIDTCFWDSDYMKETSVLVGRTTLLLPVFKEKKIKCYPRCHDHSLLYNL